MGTVHWLKNKRTRTPKNERTRAQLLEQLDEARGEAGRGELVACATLKVMRDGDREIAYCNITTRQLAGFALGILREFLPPDEFLRS